ncbi:MAG: hypothetical protein M3R24_11945 [Chloroflexota bacterium]|nr:hypothetical protein [Chloroflexota bacterium]
MIPSASEDRRGGSGEPTAPVKVQASAQGKKAEALRAASEEALRDLDLARWQFVTAARPRFSTDPNHSAVFARMR